MIALFCRRLVLFLVLGLLVERLRADDVVWPAFGGPSGAGHVPADQSDRLPRHWDEASGRNIAWKIPLAGHGYSSPVVGDGRLWFTSATADGRQQFVYAIDAATGEVLHHKLLFTNQQPEPLGNPINTYASPTGVLEPGALYVHFGTYGTARLDPSTGEVVWQRRDLNCRHYRGPGSSPVVAGDLVILTFDGIDRQFIAALDKHTGSTVWQVDRSTDYGDLGADGKPAGGGDYRKAFNTPSVVQVAGEKQVVSVGAKAAYGYDLATGREIWTVRHDNYNAAARTLFVDGLAIINTGSNNAHLLAIRLDGTTRGDITGTHLAWRRARANNRLPTSVLVEGRLFMPVDNGVVYCLDPLSGKELGARRVGGSLSASPLVIGGLIYLCDEAGKTTVVEATPDLSIVAENQLDEGMRASPVAAYGALYLRTFDHLYKIAAP